MCRLPSGRVLYYPNARPSNNGFDMDGKNVWHGILVENVCQAVARDLLAHALLECEKEGFDVRFHVHDEIVCYGQPEELEKLEEVMCRLPDWAKGIPMNAEGEVSPWYKK
jgi:DNA polymerase